MEVSSRPGYRSPGFIAAGFFLLAVLSTPKITRWLEDRSPLPVDAEVLAG